MKTKPKSACLIAASLLAMALMASGFAFAARRVVISWNPVPPPVDHYRIYRGVSPGGPYTLMGTVPSSQTTFTNGSNPDGTPLTEGVTYYYVITALNGVAESKYSNEPFVIIPATPPAPTGATAVLF